MVKVSPYPSRPQSSDVSNVLHGALPFIALTAVHVCLTFLHHTLFNNTKESRILFFFFF